MNIALWIVQVALAAVFVMSGGFKVVQPIETLGAEMAWVADVSPALIRFIEFAKFWVRWESSYPRLPGFYRGSPHWLLQDWGS